MNFEEQLERLIEGSFARLFRGPLQPREVAIKLLRAIEDNALPGPGGREAAPTQYQIHLHPVDKVDLLARTPDLNRQLSGQVVGYCLETGLNLLSTPEILLIADPSTPPHSLHIVARHVIHEHETTQIMEPINMPPAPPKNAHLVIDGKRTVPLTGTLFNIGRHPNNDLVLSDLYISRHHAQIRLQQGQYVIYDRESRSGIFVNGQRTTEHPLTPGDTIRIGGVNLVYNEQERAADITDTQIDLVPPEYPEGLPS